MRLIIDRFEGDIAVCEKEDGGHIDIPKSLLPNGVHEGEAVEEKDGSYSVLFEETAARRKEIRNLLKGLIKE